MHQHGNSQMTPRVGSRGYQSIQPRTRPAAARPTPLILLHDIAQTCGMMVTGLRILPAAPTTEALALVVHGADLRGRGALSALGVAGALLGGVGAFVVVIVVVFAVRGLGGGDDFGELALLLVVVLLLLLLLLTGYGGGWDGRWRHGHGRRGCGCGCRH